jgi:ABC-type antimicrobial peptide transport system permease subunit
MTLLVRTTGDPQAVVDAVRQLVRAIDPGMPIPVVETIAQRIDDSVAQDRLVATLATVFGVIALLLASIGLCGVMAYTVSRRRAEFGLRMALGATRSWVLGAVFGDSLRLLAAGILVGVPVALAASRAISSRLFGIEPMDPLTMAGAVLVLSVTALLAALRPALRASQIDPSESLRAD